MQVGDISQPLLFIDVFCGFDGVHGVGSWLMNGIINDVKRRNYAGVVLHSLRYIKDWYHKLGFRVRGGTRTAPFCMNPRDAV